MMANLKMVNAKMKTKIMMLKKIKIDNETENENESETENSDESIDLQSEEVKNMIANQERADEQDEQINFDNAFLDQNKESDLVTIPQDITMELMNINENLRQVIIADINLMSNTGRHHHFCHWGDYNNRIHM